MTRYRMNEPVLSPEQARYVREAVKLRRTLSTKSLAARLKVSTSTIVKYGNAYRGRGLEKARG